MEYEVLKSATYQNMMGLAQQRQKVFMEVLKQVAEDRVTDETREYCKKLLEQMNKKL